MSNTNGNGHSATQRTGERILVLGGAGFIGSHLVDALIACGHQVRVLDALVPQVHGPEPLGAAGRPRYLHPAAEFIRADITDAAAVRRALTGIEVVYHEAAEVGVGQSMYEIVRYTQANTLGTAVLLEALTTDRGAVRKVIVASSMSIYGEGAYHCPTHGRVYPKLRGEAQLAARDWEMHCPICAGPATPAPTAEDKPLFPTSIYAINKRDQEEMCLAVGRAYGIPTVALRYFNVYGTRQALSNPYTGVAAIFSGRLLNNKPPMIFEDGGQQRDFIHVSDIVQANLRALETDAADYEALNIGTGQCVTVREVAEALAAGLGKAIAPEIVRQFRAGDIRHCYADISKAHRLLGYVPTVRFSDGVAELLAWVRDQQATDRADQARAELVGRGLAS
ncbi:MAG: NAD-dependent epimerase/dehydratase family protein [Chloroflexota bacterium]|nr:NAD-dependent epimerase/dehydratase family protein [Chloroflexota bacterium]